MNDNGFDKDCSLGDEGIQMKVCSGRGALREMNRRESCTGRGDKYLQCSYFNTAIVLFQLTTLMFQYHYANFSILQTWELNWRVQIL